MINKEYTAKATEINRRFSDLKRAKRRLNKIKWIIAGVLSLTAIFVVFWVLALIPSTFSAKLKVYKYEFTYTDYDEFTALFVYNKHYLHYAGTLGAVAFYSIALVLVCLPFYLFSYFYLYRVLYLRKLEIVKKSEEKYREELSR